MNETTIWTPELERQQTDSLRRHQREQCAQGLHSVWVSCRATGMVMCRDCRRHAETAPFICDISVHCDEHER